MSCVSKVVWLCLTMSLLIEKFYGFVCMQQCPGLSLCNALQAGLPVSLSNNRRSLFFHLLSYLSSLYWLYRDSHLLHNFPHSSHVWNTAYFGCTGYDLFFWCGIFNKHIYHLSAWLKWCFPHTRIQLLVVNPLSFYIYCFDISLISVYVSSQ